MEHDEFADRDYQALTYGFAPAGIDVPAVTTDNSPIGISSPQSTRPYNPLKTSFSYTGVGQFKVAKLNTSPGVPAAIPFNFSAGRDGVIEQLQFRVTGQFFYPGYNTNNASFYFNFLYSPFSLSVVKNGSATPDETYGVFSTLNNVIDLTVPFVQSDTITVFFSSFDGLVYKNDNNLYYSVMVTVRGNYMNYGNEQLHENYTYYVRGNKK